MSLEENLKEETKKWLQRAEGDLDEIILQKADGQRFLTNIAAYISDTRYFLERGDLIRAFEAVIWAWAWIEIGLDMGALVREDDG